MESNGMIFRVVYSANPVYSITQHKSIDLIACKDGVVEGKKITH
jgi:hypothetical protein